MGQGNSIRAPSSSPSPPPPSHRLPARVVHSLFTPVSQRSALAILKVDQEKLYRITGPDRHGLDRQQETENSEQRLRIPGLGGSIRETCPHIPHYRPSLPQPQRFRGTVMLYEIDGLHWAFRSPVTGPGYYVLLCNPKDKDF
ncbi:hypothetical protein CONLIGDRAFT_685897 [Coniochaeta ligniaria NRRL 30616]|uniref:Uncharacterized protein n=1 Tax=Coniochaeta ligniaria NRRL 30616 TaxID=1408157 RepID=A0A1J7IAE1_9PEZI|nr:hypothetical protein CONLIGDRAFT_685897 [Coniochaeta ligniaria NRRL 30616]